MQVTCCVLCKWPSGRVVCGVSVNTCQPKVSCSGAHSPSSVIKGKPQSPDTDQLWTRGLCCHRNCFIIILHADGQRRLMSFVTYKKTLRTLIKCWALKLTFRGVSNCGQRHDGTSAGTAAAWWFGLKGSPWASPHSYLLACFCNGNWFDYWPKLYLYLREKYILLPMNWNASKLFNFS